MTKQEEIREGIAKDIHYWHTTGTEDWDRPESWHGPKIENYYEAADTILNNLHSQGCVLKVDRDSVYCNIPMDKVPLSGKTAYVETKELEKAGYVAVEPLIEETRCLTE